MGVLLRWLLLSLVAVVSNQANVYNMGSSGMVRAPVGVAVPIQQVPRSFNAGARAQLNMGPLHSSAGAVDGNKGAVQGRWLPRAHRRKCPSSLPYCITTKRPTTKPTCPPNKPLCTTPKPTCPPNKPLCTTPKPTCPPNKPLCTTPKPTCPPNKPLCTTPKPTCPPNKPLCTTRPPHQQQGQYPHYPQQWLSQQHGAATGDSASPSHNLLPYPPLSPQHHHGYQHHGHIWKPHRLTHGFQPQRLSYDKPMPPNRHSKWPWKVLY